jgi:hypothetical protein
VSTQAVLRRGSSPSHTSPHHHTVQATAARQCAARGSRGIHAVAVLNHFCVQYSKALASRPFVASSLASRALEQKQALKLAGATEFSCISSMSFDDDLEARPLRETSSFTSALMRHLDSLTVIVRSPPPLSPPLLTPLLSPHFPSPHPPSPSSPPILRPQLLFCRSLCTFT